MQKMNRLVLPFLLMFLMGGCAAAPGGENQTEEAQTPTENTQAADVTEAGEETATDSEKFSMFTPIAEGEEVAVMTTSMGEIKIRFFKDKAPKAVENFITHAKNGYYDGLTFHRVIDGFMIQGGDPLGTGTGGESIWGEPFEDEFDINLLNIRGALSMANSGANTNGSQFFIVQNNSLTPGFEAYAAEFQAYIDNPEQVIGSLEDKTEVTAGEFFPLDVFKYYIDNGGAPHLDFKHTVFGFVYEGMDIVDAIAKVEVDGKSADKTGNDKPLTDVIIEKVEIQNYKS